MRRQRAVAMESIPATCHRDELVILLVYITHTPEAHSMLKGSAEERDEAINVARKTQTADSTMIHGLRNQRAEPFIQMMVAAAIQASVWQLEPIRAAAAPAWRGLS